MSKSLNELSTADLLDLLKNVDKDTWIKVGIGLAFFALFGFFIARPAWFERGKLKKELKTIEQKINTYETLKIQEPHMLRRRDDYLNFILGAKNRLFDKGEASLLLGKISKLATESGVTIVASRPKEFERKFPNPFNDLYEASQYDFTVEGGYHNIGQFVSRIESFPKLLRVRMMKITTMEPEVAEETGEIIGEQKHYADLSLTAVSFKKVKASS